MHINMYSGYKKCLRRCVLKLIFKKNISRMTKERFIANYVLFDLLHYAISIIVRSISISEGETGIRAIYLNRTRVKL